METSVNISVSELCFKNVLGLLINNRSNFWEERIIVRKIAATFREERIVVGNFRGESPSKANYHSKNRADQNNRCHENAGKFRRNIVSSEISSKSQEFRRNSFALLLHNTVGQRTSLSKFGRNISTEICGPPPEVI